ncbi:MAG: hypothetical protein C4547_07450 [Phycisphaerales bacterium]|nr:MAG: hypothetical protein C4547_07450 [Phycisphaerales bacterium]
MAGDWWDRLIVRRGHLFSASVMVGVLLGAPMAMPQQPRSDPTEAKAPQSETETGPGGKRVAFAPGVTLDWGRKAVEVAGVVVLREGPLELLACSPRTREHESIIRVDARPVDIFKAMGLVGIEPGKPVRYDEEKDAWLPPVGEAVDLRIVYEHAGRRRAVAAADWLLDVHRKAPPEGVEWVFAGSMVFEGGEFGATVDGTVVCVVDFSTALIAISGLHTAANESLWLAANTEAIPPLGTECALVIRSAARATLVVTLTADGRLTLKEKPVTFAELALLQRQDDRVIELRVDAGTADAEVSRAAAEMVKAGVPLETIRIVKPKADGPAQTKPAP